MPNVHAIGWRPQATIDAYNRSFDVGLIPYRVDHPFNVACCPTKIMDYMAAGRPVVSTDLPECRLYRPPVRRGRRPSDSSRPSPPGSPPAPTTAGPRLRLDFARANSCRRVAERLLDWIDRG